MKRQMGCGAAIHRPRPIFYTLFLLLLVSCQLKPYTATLALLGDLMIGRAVTPTPASLSYLSSELEAADLSLANLESPLAILPPTMDARAGYNLCTSAARTELLSAWGLDLLSVLNNHSFDCGPTGPNETASLLTSAGLYPIGLSPEPLTLRINGLELAFLAFDDILSPIETSTSIRAIQFARANGALVVVSIHWGMEYHQGPSDRQKTLAQQFADAGAVLVVGTHPHVLQPAEWIRTAWGQTLVLFSLGNAMFDQGGLADTRQSALITVKLDSHGVKSARTAPFEIDVSRSLIIQPDVQTAQQIRDRINLP